MSSPVLEVEELKKHFSQQTSVIDLLLRRRGEPVKAVDGVTLELGENDSQGIIGESGCGKTTLLQTLMGLNEPTDGSIKFRSHALSEFSRKEMKEFRGNAQMIFQDPFNSLNPKMTVRQTLSESLEIHGFDDHEQRILEMLERVELNPASDYIDRFPRHLSGGERQRVSIARALIVEPEIILADEPVSMLDVSTQASILNLLSNLIDEFGVSMFYISHDLSTVSYVCDQIHVMYLGRIVESAPTEELLADPKHPYTKALIDAVPLPDPDFTRQRTALEGAVMSPVGLGDGCRFRDRCPERMDICEQRPRTVRVDDHEARSTACHLYYDHESEQAGEGR